MPEIDSFLGSATAIPAGFGAVLDVERLTHNAGNAATGGVWRVTGASGRAVVKVARPPSQAPTGNPAWQTSLVPSHWNFWRREAYLYESGLVDAYADAGIVAPALLSLGERGDGSVELWLADADGAAGTSWSVQRLARFAYELGVAQARWVDRVPDIAWLSRDWLAQYVTFGPPTVTLDPDWAHPFADLWSLDSRRRVNALWVSRGRAVAAARQAPRTLCHLDVWPKNLVDRDGVSVLFDWAFAGEGGLGEDAANLIVDSVADGFISTSLLPEINFEVSHRYTEGLRDGGWHGSDDVVRTAIAVAGVAKYCWLSPASLGAAIGNSYGRSAYGKDRDPSEAMRRLSPLVDLLAEWAELAGIG